jgi:putative DNA primase/helicase
MTAVLSVSDLASRLKLRRGPGQRGYRGACPACSYPDAFSMKPGKGDNIGLFCASCGDREAIADAVTRAVGGAWAPPSAALSPDDPAAAQRRQAKALSLWAGSVPAAVGTLADTYLTARALPGLALSLALRFRADCPHPEGGRLPAMVAEVVAVSGTIVALHRTFLRGDGGGKANVEPPRASLGPVWGGAVRLAPVAEELVVGEGIETSASAGSLLGLPAWAAIAAGNLARGLVLPAEVRRVVIAADADEPGERAAREAALRWQREGRTVSIARPDKRGCDFNDILLGCEHA